MRKILIAVMAMVTFLVLITAPLAFAAIYDVQNDFSITNNPTGAWSYGWESAPGGTFNLYTHVTVIPGYDYLWYDTINFYGWYTPSVWFTNGVVWFHPGPSPIDQYPSSTESILSSGGPHLCQGQLPLMGCLVAAVLVI